jgi:hypothetical protein
MCVEYLKATPCTLERRSLLLSGVGVRKPSRFMAIRFDSEEGPRRTTCDAPSIAPVLRASCRALLVVALDLDQSAFGDMGDSSV